MIFVVKLRLQEGRRSPVIIWLCPWFSSICFGEISQNFHNLGDLSCRSFKSRKKIGVANAVSLLFAIFWCLPPSPTWSYEFILSTGTRKGTNMFNGPENHRKCQQRQRDKFFSKIPIFFVAKYYVVVDLYLSMRKLSNLSRHVSPFGNLSHGVFFSVDLFSGRRRPMNITGAVAGSPLFHFIKTVLCSTVFNTPFQMTTVRSYLAAMFVFHVDTFKNRAMLAPRSRAVKKPQKASITNDIQQIILSVEKKFHCMSAQSEP